MHSAFENPRLGCLYAVALALILSIAGCGDDEPENFVDLTLTGANSYDAGGYHVYKDFDEGKLKVERSGSLVIAQSTQGAVKYMLFGSDSRYLIIEDNYDVPNGERFDIYLANLTQGRSELIRQDAIALTDPQMAYERHPDGSLVFGYMKVGHPTSHKFLKVLHAANLDDVVLCQIPNPGVTQGDLHAEATAGEVTIRDEDGYSASCPLPSGEGHFELSPNEIDFGEVRQGETVSSELTIHNGGGASLSFTGQVTSAVADVFALQPDSGSVAPGEDETLTVTFSPTLATDAGEVSGSIEFDHNGSSAGDSVALVGQVLAVPPSMRVDTQPIDFGPVVPGLVATRELAVHNDGGQAFNFSLETTAPFHARQIGSGPVEPLGQKTIEVEFRPPCDAAAGDVASNLGIEADYGATAVVPLSGTVTVAPEVRVTPDSLDFGTITVGHQYAEVIEIANLGVGAPVRYRYVQSDNPLFAVTRVGGEVSPGDERYVGVTAQPGEDIPAGPVSGNVTFEYLHGDCPATFVSIPVQAEVSTEPPPHAVIAGPPSHLTFVGVFAGDSASKEFEIISAGDLPLEFAIASSDPMFSVSPATGSLAPTERQPVTVTFAPPEDTAAGSHYAQLTITHNDPYKDPITIILQGVVEASDWVIAHEAEDLWLLGLEASRGFRVDAVGGQPGVILSSTDRGVHWQRIVQNAGHHLTDIDIKGATGIAVGADTLILRSDNGGYNWTQLSGVPADAGLSAVHLVDYQTGWIVGGEGTILRTEDGGQSWTAKDCVGGAPLSDIDATGATHAWAVGSQGGLVCRTSDGGESWSFAFLSANWSLKGVDFSGTTHGLAVGDNGLILRSQDGGASWETVPANRIFLHEGEVESLQLNAVILFEAYGRAWAVGDDGVILFSYNGGRDWYQQRTNLPNDLTAIAHDGNTLWVTGRPGIVLRRDWVGR